MFVIAKIYQVLRKWYSKDFFVEIKLEKFSYLPNALIF